MSSRVIISATYRFLANAKKLAKKYPSLKSDLLSLQNELLTDPKMGMQIKENVYKIRLAIKSKNRGKSGGARVITYYFEESLAQNVEELFLLTIYDKADSENINDTELGELVTEVQLMLKERSQELGEE